MDNNKISQQSRLFIDGVWVFNIRTQNAINGRYIILYDTDFTESLCSVFVPSANRDGLIILNDGCDEIPFTHFNSIKHVIDNFNNIFKTFNQFNV